MSRVLVVGNATVDIIQRISRFPQPGETLLAEGMLVCAGGKGLNQAVAAARTGAGVRLKAPVGADANARLLADTLAGEKGLSVAWVETSAPTDVSAIWIDAAGENEIVSSAAAARALTPAEASEECAGLGRGDVLLVQGNLCLDTTMAALRTARERGACTIINTAPMQAWMGECLPLADIVVANEVEARELSGGSVDPEADILARGAATLVISRGRHGATLATPARRILVDAPAVQAADTAGAGDVLTGTLAGLLALRAPAGIVGDAALPVLTDVLDMAVAAASLSVTRPGTTPSFPSAQDIAEIVRSHARRGGASATG